MSAEVLVNSIEDAYLKIRLTWPPFRKPLQPAKESRLRHMEPNNLDLPVVPRSGDLPLRLTPEGQSAAFSLLKQRLLLQLLDVVADHAIHHLIINEANTTARLAAATAFPLLVYPCLFHERASEALSQDRRRTSAYWKGLNST
jgi:hypothetical protein